MKTALMALILFATLASSASRVNNGFAQYDLLLTCTEVIEPLEFRSAIVIADLYNSVAGYYLDVYKVSSAGEVDIYQGPMAVDTSIRSFAPGLFLKNDKAGVQFYTTDLANVILANFGNSEMNVPMTCITSSRRF